MPSRLVKIILRERLIYRRQVFFKRYVEWTSKNPEEAEKIAKRYKEYPQYMRREFISMVPETKPENILADSEEYYSTLKLARRVYEKYLRNGLPYTFKNKNGTKITMSKQRKTVHRRSEPPQKEEVWLLSCDIEGGSHIDLIYYKERYGEKKSWLDALCDVMVLPTRVHILRFGTAREVVFDGQSHRGPDRGPLLSAVYENQDPGVSALLGV